MITIIILEKGVDILKLLVFYCGTTSRGSILKTLGADFWENIPCEFSLAIELSYILA